MTGCSPMSTPMVTNIKLSHHETDSTADPHLYRSIVGALQYITITRPDLAFNVNKVCQFLASPLETHWRAVKSILRYLGGTSNLGLLLQPAPTSTPFSLRVYSDTNWANDPDDHRSTSVVCLYFGPNLVSWNSKKQTMVACSSAEDEYRGIVNTTAELMWVKSLLSELKVPFQTPTLLCDNLSAVMIVRNSVFHSRTKNLELDVFFVCEKVVKKEMQDAPAMMQIADILTKPLSLTLFNEFRVKLKVGSAL